MTYEELMETATLRGEHGETSVQDLISNNVDLLANRCAYSAEIMKGEEDFVPNCVVKLRNFLSNSEVVCDKFFISYGRESGANEKAVDDQSKRETRSLTGEIPLKKRKINASHLQTENTFAQGASKEPPIRTNEAGKRNKEKRQGCGFAKNVVAIGNAQVELHKLFNSVENKRSDCCENSSFALEDAGCSVAIALEGAAANLLTLVQKWESSSDPWSPNGERDWEVLLYHDLISSVMQEFCTGLLKEKKEFHASSCWECWCQVLGKDASYMKLATSTSARIQWKPLMDDTVSFLPMFGEYKCEILKTSDYKRRNVLKSIYIAVASLKLMKIGLSPRKHNKLFVPFINTCSHHIEVFVVAPCESESSGNESYRVFSLRQWRIGSPGDGFSLRNLVDAWSYMWLLAQYTISQRELEPFSYTGKAVRAAVKTLEENLRGRPSKKTGNGKSNQSNS